MEQVREIDGEQAYEKMRRAVEKASQVERASQPVRTSQYSVAQKAGAGWDGWGGPERDYGPSR